MFRFCQRVLKCWDHVKKKKRFNVLQTTDVEFSDCRVRRYNIPLTYLGYIVYTQKTLFETSEVSNVNTQTNKYKMLLFAVYFLTTT